MLGKRTGSVSERLEIGRLYGDQAPDNEKTVQQRSLTHLFGAVEITGDPVAQSLFVS